MDEQSKQAKESIKNAGKQMAKEAAKKTAKEVIKKTLTTIIAAIGIKGMAIGLVIAIVLGGTIFLAGAVYYNDWDRNKKVVEIKQEAFGDEALGKVITLDDGKYKIQYESEDGTKVGKDAIYTILQEHEMNFEDFTEEEIDCLYKCLKAEWATTYPNLGQDVDNKDIDSEFIQGVITVRRGNYTTPEGKTLTYKPYEEFSQIKDAGALDYFSLKDGNIIVASWSSNEIKYEINEIKGSLSEEIKSRYTSSGKEISIVETAINYKSMIGIHSVPFEFLLALLVNTEDVDFVSEIVDSALDGTIEITIYDNTTQITTIEKEHTKEITTYEKNIDYTIKTEYQEILASGDPGRGGVTYTNGNETIISDDKKELEYEVTKTTITESNSYVVGLTNVSSWLADIENNYSYSPEYGEKIDLGSGTEYNYGPEVKEEYINPPSSDYEVETFRRNKESIITSVDDYNKSTHQTIKTCIINSAKKQGTLNGKNTLLEYSSITNNYKYEKGTTQISNIGEKFKQAYDNNTEAQGNLKSVDEWLFELLEETEAGVDYVSIMKYLLYLCTGKDYGVTEEDILSLLEVFEITNLNYANNTNSFNQFIRYLHSWEGGGTIYKDAKGNDCYKVEPDRRRRSCGRLWSRYSNTWSQN